jgi:hypothetical protein
MSCFALDADQRKFEPASVTASHPDLDCVFLNSGIQRRSIFSEPETIDIDRIQEELTVSRQIALTLCRRLPRTDKNSGCLGQLRLLSCSDEGISPFLSSKIRYAYIIYLVSARARLRKRTILAQHILYLFHY